MECYRRCMTTAAGDIRRRSGSYANGLIRRNEILKVASAQFAKRGFARATILEIAEACGISRAGLLHHFPDKEALLEAVLVERDAEDRARFRPYGQLGRAAGILRGMVDLAAHNRLVPGLIELFTRLSVEATDVEHPAHVYFQTRYARILESTAAVLGAGVSEGAVKPDIDVTSTALRLTALMDGLQSMWLRDRTIDMAAQMETAILEALTEAGGREFLDTRISP